MSTASKPMTPFESVQPRYLAVAEALAQAIKAQQYRVGGLLPTEIELCHEFGVSRHTIREAIRKLHELGLVTRHQGVGTRVRNSEISGRYVVALNSISEMWRHVQAMDSKVVFRAAEKREKALFALPRFAGDDVLQRVDVLRSKVDGKKSVPMSLSHIYINNAYRDILDSVDSAKVPIFSLIEEKYAQKVISVEQEISATLLDKKTARLLKAQPDTPALSIVRIYKGKGDIVMQASQAVSPADRFTYTMELHLEYAPDRNAP